jgi:hypothetical protein
MTQGSLTAAARSLAKSGNFVSPRFKLIDGGFWHANSDIVTNGVRGGNARSRQPINFGVWLPRNTATSSHPQSPGSRNRFKFRWTAEQAIVLATKPGLGWIGDLLPVN